MSANNAVSENFLYFYCKKCKIAGRVPELEAQYDEAGNPILLCDECGNPMSMSNHHLFNLSKGWSKATGPKTPEGKAKNAQNLDGHRGKYKSEETKERASCNGFKTGQYCTKPRIIAPAIHGRYLDCEDCELSESCEKKEIKWCPVFIQPLVNFLAAHKNSDPSQLKTLVGDSHAQLYAIQQQAMNEIFKDGAVVEDVKIYKDTIQKTKKSHPAIESVLKIMDTIGFTADQQNMTPARQDSDDDLGGFLKDTADANKTVAETASQMMDMMKTFQNDILAKAEESRQKDTALTQYNEEKDNEDKG